MVLIPSDRPTAPQLALATVLALASVACSGESTDESNQGAGGSDAGSAGADGGTLVYPVPDWRVDPPEDHGFDADELQAAADFAGVEQSYCLVVTHRGAIVGEWYWNAWDAETEQGVFSVTKSFTSALVGIAQDRGELSIDEPASKYIEEWVDTESASVAIENLLGNDSGREWTFEKDYVQMAFSEPDKTAFALALGQDHPPGTYWEYNNSAIQTLDRVLSNATGAHPADYAREHLLGPLGSNSTYGRDASGNAIMFSELSASCRDLARFGYLYLRGGTWADGEQIVSSEHVRASTTSGPRNAAYGYLWWLNRDGHWVLPSAPARTEGDGLLMAGVPDDAFAALGLGSQIVAVIPSREIVFTRIGASSTTDPAGSQFAADLTRMVNDALVP